MIELIRGFPGFLGVARRAVRTQLAAMLIGMAPDAVRLQSEERLIQILHQDS